MYLTFEEYTSMGGTKDETTFNLLEFEARATVDWYTFDRLKKMTRLPEEVKMCMMYLISQIEKIQDAENAGLAVGIEGTASKSVASQSNDGVSISYNNISYSDLLKTFRESQGDTIRKYLHSVVNELGHKVLYRGIYEDE